MKKNGFCKIIIGLSSLGLMSVLSSTAYASGYNLEFQSASVLADAGEAAVVEDAGTNWYNSAGLVYIPQQLALSGIQLYQQSTFTGSAFAPSPFGNNYFAQGSKTSYVTPYLPAIHYAHPFNDRWAAGISVVPAWGLQEGWNDNGFLRYTLQTINTKTIDIAPSIAFKINNQWSVGLGPDITYFSLQNSSAGRTEGPAGIGGTANDSVSYVSANNWGEGWHAGVLYRASDTTRIGLNYRSKIVMNLNGYSDFGYNGFGAFETNNFTFHTAFPPITTLSIYHDMNERWAMMGTVAYDQWNVIRYNNAQNYQSLGTIINVGIPEFYSNTVDLSVGTHYKLNDKLMLRGSFKYEDTPTNTVGRNIDNPDAPKYGLNVGFRYQMMKKVAVDAIYAHVFTKTVRINNTNIVTGANVNGHVSTSIDLIGAQLVWDI